MKASDTGVAYAVTGVAGVSSDRSGVGAASGRVSSADEFVECYERADGAPRREVAMGLMVGGLGLMVASVAAGVPASLGPAMPFLSIGIIAAATMRWVSCRRSTPGRWSTGLFIVAAYLDLACGMTAHVVGIHHGLHVIPLLMTVAVLGSLLVAHIPFAVLAPALVVGTAAVDLAELSLLPVDGRRVMEIASINAMLIVALVAVFTVEKVARSAWLRCRVVGELTLTDSLTRLPNRRALHNAFVSLAADRVTAVLAIVDIDEFKQFNDKFGHPAGDRCLESIGACLRAGTDPAHEVVARIGGEEFVILWHGLDSAAALGRLAELTARIRDLDLPAGSGDGRLTVSVGVAQSDGAVRDPAAAQCALLRAADEALYRAKTGGRDRVCVAVDRVRESGRAAVSKADRGLCGGMVGATVRSGAAHASAADFRAVLDRHAMPIRCAVMLGILVFYGLVQFVQRVMLGVPSDLTIIGGSVFAIGILPPVVIAIAACSVKALRYWSSHIYLVCVATILTAQVVARAMQFGAGVPVSPIVVPIAVLLSLSVAHIGYTLLFPTAVTMMTVLVGVQLVCFPFTPRDLIITITVIMGAVALRFARCIEWMRRADWCRAEELSRVSMIDPLTGLSNRRAFDVRLTEGFADGVGHTAVVLVDIDHLKAYNDAFGHLAGDECIRRVGDALSRVCRHDDDLVARLGGEEFAVVLRGRCRAELAGLATTVVDAVRAMRIPSTTEHEVVTVSAGLAFAMGGDTPDDVIERADVALYRAKYRGRNALAEYSLA